jgi:hypothetical protein
VSFFFKQGVQIELDKLTAKQSIAKPKEMIKISIKFTFSIRFKNYAKIQQRTMLHQKRWN